jgi:hypothetical protein
MDSGVATLCYEAGRKRGAADAAAGSGQVKRQRNGFVAVCWLEHKQYRYAMLVTVVTVTYACIALDDEPIIGESTQVVETIKVSEHLGANAAPKVLIAWLEHCPACGRRYGTDYLQTSAAHRQLRKLTVDFTSPSHRDRAIYAASTRWPVGNDVQAGTMQ